MEKMFWLVSRQFEKKRPKAASVQLSASLVDTVNFP